MPETPFLLKYTRYINKELRAVNELKKELKVRQFNNEAEFKPKKKDNIFAKALSPFSKAKDVAEDIGEGAWKGLEVYGNQVQSVPAALFTRGQVQDGQYTTKRNLIGNPIANVASHVKAQRQLGLVDEKQASGNILERLQEGFESANRAGKAYSEDPNIPSGVKFATGVAFDPSSYLAAGTVSKLPKVAKIGGAKGALARAPLQVIEGFDKPSTLAKFTVGGALGTQIADKVNIPGIGEGVEQFVGGMLGGGLAARPKGGFNQPQTKALTEVVTQEDRLHHGTFRTIPEGSIVTSIRGDIGPGLYTSLNDPSHAGSYVEGDLGANVTGFSPEYIAQAKKDISEHGGQQIYQFRPKRDLFLLHWEEGLDKVESSRINNVLQKRGVEVRVQTGMTGKQVFDVITENKYGKKDSSASYIDKGTPNVTGVLNDAGFDGMTNGDQYTIWRPNEVLESDLTPRKADYVTPRGVPAGTVVNKGQLTQTQIEKMDDILYAHDEFDPQEVVQYFKQHTDSYGDKLPGSPTIQQYIAELDNEKVKADYSGGPKSSKEQISAAGNPFAWDDISGELIFADGTKAVVKIKLDGTYELGQYKASTIADLVDTVQESWDAQGINPSKPVANVGKAIQPKQGVMLSTKQLSTKSYLKQMYPHLPDDVVHKYVLQNYGLDGKHLGGEMTLLDYAKQEIGPAANPMGKYPGHIGYKEDITLISPEEIAGIKPKPKQSTWTVAGKQVDSKTILKYNNLSSKQKDLVHQISGLHPDDDLSPIIDQVVKNTVTDGTWKPYKEVTAKPAPKLVTPEEIMGLDQPTGPKTVDEFIEFTEKELGPQNKYGDAKDYAAPGQEGSPIAGAPKGKGSVQPVKQAGVWKAAGYENEDLGDLINELKTAGYKVDPPEGMSLGGGAPGESLVSPREVHVGLTKSEKIGNALNKVKNVIIDHGIKNNEVATPIAKEYLRINQVMKVQATNLGKLAHRAEHMLGIKDITEVNLEGLTPAQNRVVERLRYMITSFDETLDQFDTEFKSIHEFWDDVRLEEGASKKKFSDVLTEYGNAIANKVSDAWLKTELKKLEGAISLSGEGGVPIPTSTVSRVSDVKLPKAVGEVINRAVDRVHPTRDSEWAQLYTTVNNTFRSMWAAGDASFQFIQMLPTWADNPKRAFQATVTGLRSTKDPTFMADFIQRHDELRMGSNKPKVTEYLKHGGYIAESLGEGTDLGGLPGKIQKIPGYGKFLEKSNILFIETGNANRIALWDMLWDQYEAGGASMLTGLYTKSGKAVTNSSTRAQVLEAIANAGNRATGYSSKGFGGPYGSAIFFAPRFIQSQIEMVIKAAWGNGIESQVARRQLLKLIAVGTGITVAANEARGKDTEFDPRNSNFMRILDVGGADLSVFGPWDSLVKGVIRSVPHPDENGDFTLGDPTYLLRTKLAPVPSVLWDLTSGKDIIGNKTGLNSIDKIADLLLPFSIQDIGEEPIASTIFGLLGGKSTPLSDTEVLNSRLKSAGVDPEDLVAKKEYLAQHPNLVPKAEEGSYKRSQEITTDIKERRLANDNLTKSNGQSLVEFREKRKLLLTEQRNRREEVIKEDTKKANTQQKKWLNSYMEIFDESKVKDYITNELNPEAFDIAVGKWANENGTEALDFINRYMGAGLNEVERAYYTDIRKLDAVGYFDLPKYQNMKSDLTEDQIDSLVANVDAIRAGNPKLQSEPWATTARRLLKQSISSVEILDIIHSRQDSYANKDRTKLKEEFAKETLWFNSRANWDSYINYKPGKKMPKIGGALKANLKPVLK